MYDDDDHVTINSTKRAHKEEMEHEHIMIATRGRYEHDRVKQMSWSSLPVTDLSWLPTICLARKAMVTADVKLLLYTY